MHDASVEASDAPVATMAQVLDDAVLTANVEGLGIAVETD